MDSENQTLPAEPAAARSLPIWEAVTVVACLTIAALIAFPAIGAWRSRAGIQASSAEITMNSLPIVTTITGTVKTVAVKPGDHVSRGQVLATLDSTALAASVNREQLALDQALKDAQNTQAAVLPAQMTGPLPAIPIQPPVAGSSGPPPPAPTRNDPNGVLITMLTAKKAHAADRLKQLDTARRQANGRLTEVQDDAESAARAAQTAKGPLDGLNANLEMAKAQRDKFQDLYNQGIVSRNELQNKQAEVDAAQAALDAALKQIADAEALVKQRQGEVEAARKTLQDLTAQLDAAQKFYASIQIHATLPPKRAPQPLITPVPKPKPAPQAFAPVRVAFPEERHREAEAKIATARQALEQAQQELQATFILATQDGIVTEVAARPGQTLLAGSRILTVGDPATTKVVAQLSHKDALRIQRGSPCEIAVSGRSPEEFSGSVRGFVTAGNDHSPATVEIVVAIPPDQLAALGPNAKVAVRLHPK